MANHKAREGWLGWWGVKERERGDCQQRQHQYRWDRVGLATAQTVITGIITGEQLFK